MESVKMGLGNGFVLEESLVRQRGRAVLGVTRQRVYQLVADREDFPRPLSEEAGGTDRMWLWSRLEVEEWNLKARAAGRPPKDPARPMAFAIDLEVSFDPRFAPTTAGKEAFAQRNLAVLEQTT